MTNLNNTDAAQLISELLNKLKPGAALPGGAPRPALICHPDSTIRTRLAEHFSAASDFEVQTSDKLGSALSALREGRVNILVIDFYFDSEQRAAEVLRRYVDQLKPKARRQLFVVLIAPSYRTLDPNAAFIEGVNAVINSEELGNLRPALERSLREYNVLYRTFNEVTGRIAF